MAKLAMDDAFFFARALKWYKRAEVQDAILECCEHREVSPRYGEGFGKRPDALFYPADILNLAQKRATSFHCSEERWRDPLALQTGAPRRQMDELRIGWDLVLDVDCPYWEYAKLTTELFVQALRSHGIRSISTKFSGNKGFHVGVPFEAFPREVNGRPLSELFPEGPRAIAAHILAYVADPANRLIVPHENVIVFFQGMPGERRISFEDLKAQTGKESSELIAKTCRHCGMPATQQVGPAARLYLCASCGHTARTEKYEDYLRCERCNGVMQPQKAEQGANRCARCNHDEFEPRFNVQALIEVDTVLLASRHLFRTPWSLHEKSGLASVVFPAEKVMAFEKEWAKPDKITSFPKFLDASNADPAEGIQLLQRALDLAAERERASGREQKEYAIPEEAIPEELFPPCMRSILKGMDDGKKRAMFAMTNFLRTCGWGNDQIEARLHEWNKANPDPIREVILKGHLRYTRLKKEVVPPPNCKSFYQDLRCCSPDGLCAKIKNPAQYAKRKAEALERQKTDEDGKPITRAKLSEEQKAMRKAYREKMKQKSSGTDA